VQVLIIAKVWNRK